MASFETKFLKSKDRIRNGIILFVFVVICASMYIATTFALVEVKKTIENQYIEDGKNLVRAYKVTFQNMINQAYLILDMYAKSDIMQNGTINQISAFFSSSQVVTPSNFLLMYYCDLQGDMYSTNGISANVSDRDYFKAITSENYIRYLGKVTKSKSTGKDCIHIARAVFDKNLDLKGLICATIELSYMKKMLETVQYSNELMPFVFDDDGVRVSGDYISSSEIKDIQNAKQASPSNDAMLSSVNAKGERVHLFIETIDSYNWTVGVSILDSVIYKTYNKLNRAQKIVFALILLSGVAFYLFAVLTLKAFQNRMKNSKKRDPLTDLLTRQAWEYEANVLLYDNPDKIFICIDGDFSDFKFINQTYGERAGTETLIKFGDALKKIQSTYGGIVARGYADHFYYFNSIVSTEDFMTKLQIVQTGLQELSEKGGYPFKLKYGISIRKQNEVVSITTLLSEASIAKKTIKDNSEVSYAIFNDELGKQIALEQKIESVMDSALEKGEFFVMYQPKINIATEKICGAEALVRWNSKDFGLLPPNKFIPLFEQNGFIRKLDFAVYEIAFKFIKKQLDAKKPIIPISLNMSRSHTDTKVFMKELLRLTNKYKIPHNLVEIEILERSVANEKPILLEITNELHKNGFTVAMDDFGSGESSLNMLTSIPVDILKFDQNFLKNASNFDNSKQLISSLITMAKQLKKKTVFEGVETELQRDFLKTTDCDYIQGYFYSKPLSEEDFEKFLSEHF